jgi:hypothetical protein
LKNKDVNVLRVTLQKFVELKDPRAFPYVAQLVGSSDPKRRNEALYFFYYDRLKGSASFLATHAKYGRIYQAFLKERDDDARAYDAMGDKALTSKKAQLVLGMTFSELVALLGQPSSSVSSEDLLRGATSIMGAPPVGRQWFTWKRPEGTYTLTVQDGKLANIQNAPD